MPTVNPIVKYQEIITYISNQIKVVWDSLLSEGTEDVKKLMASIKSIEVSDEQFFRKQESDRKLRRGTVYMVVRFSSGGINFASSVTPISIYALGVANQVKPVQMLLGTFSSFWTTKQLGEGLETSATDMLQVWNTPEVISNFNVVDDDFRNLYRVTGNIVIGPDAVRLGKLTYYWGDGEDEYETVPIMAFHDNIHTSLDSQAFGNTNGFSQSEANFGTFTFSISTYLLNNHLTRDMLAVRGLRYRPNGIYSNETSKFDMNDPLKLKLEFNNDYTNMPGDDEEESADDPVKGDDFYVYYKLVDSGIGQEIAGIPTLTISVTR